MLVFYSFSLQGTMQTDKQFDVLAVRAFLDNQVNIVGVELRLRFFQQRRNAGRNPNEIRRHALLVVRMERVAFGAIENVLDNVGRQI